MATEETRRAALLAELAGYLDAEPSARSVWCAHRARRELREEEAERAAGGEALRVGPGRHRVEGGGSGRGNAEG